MTRVRRRRRVPAILAVLLSVAACAGVSPSASVPFPTPPGTLPFPVETLGPPPSRAPTPVATIANLPDPCRLLDRTEVRAALFGATFGPGIASDDGVFRRCTFTTTGSFSATFQLALGIQAQTAANFFDPQQSIEPGLGDGSQFAGTEVASPAPGVSFGLFTLVGRVGVSATYTVYGGTPPAPAPTSAASASGPASTTAASPTTIEDARLAAIQGALTRLVRRAISGLPAS